MSRRLEIGDTVSTSYNTGPYKVKKIMRGCTCPSFVQSLNGDDTPSREHMHILCKKDGDKSDYYLNGFDEDLKSVWNSDSLILHNVATINKPVQLTLF
jgi:hypothetical protein